MWNSLKRKSKEKILSESTNHVRESLLLDNLEFLVGEHGLLEIGHSTLAHDVLMGAENRRHSCRQSQVVSGGWGPVRPCRWRGAAAAATCRTCHFSTRRVDGLWTTCSRPAVPAPAARTSISSNCVARHRATSCSANAACSWCCYRVVSKITRRCCGIKLRKKWEL